MCFPFTERGESLCGRSHGTFLPITYGYLGSPSPRPVQTCSLGDPPNPLPTDKRGIDLRLKGVLILRYNCRSINVYLGCMEYGADKYCKEKAAAFQDRINHLSVEPLGRQLDCILGNDSFIPHGNGTRTGTGNGSGTIGNNGPWSLSRTSSNFVIQIEVFTNSPQYKNAILTTLFWLCHKK